MAFINNKDETSYRIEKIDNTFLTFFYKLKIVRKTGEKYEWTGYQETDSKSKRLLLQTVELAKIPSWPKDTNRLFKNIYTLSDTIRYWEEHTEIL